MRRCPACGKWTLDFDDYFGRFRCFDSDCGWMPASTAEREIRLLRSHTQPKVLNVTHIEELGLVFTATYDGEGDAFSFDFGLDKQSFDLPEPDGRLIWKIGRRSGSVTGFTILGARRFGLSQVRVGIIASRISDIERELKRSPGLATFARATKVLIEKVVVTAQEKEPPARPQYPQFTEALQQAFGSFESLAT